MVPGPSSLHTRSINPPGPFSNPLFTKLNRPQPAHKKAATQTKTATEPKSNATNRNIHATPKKTQRRHRTLLKNQAAARLHNYHLTYSIYQCRRKAAGVSVECIMMMTIIDHSDDDDDDDLHTFFSNRVTKSCLWYRKKKRKLRQQPS